MKKYFAILIVVLIGITYGFNSPVKEENSEISNTKSLPSAEEIEHQHTEIDSIELNNGTK